MKKILVIDDEEILTKTFSLLLKRKGYDIITAESGQDAEAVLEKLKFDLIISDIRMPGINGVEVINSVFNSGERYSQNKQTPVIFITGYADIKIQETAKILRPVAYIQKPFEIEELLGTIRKTLEEIK